MCTQRPPAFTLIELLVVLAIIALLVGLLLPVLGRARDAGKAVKCLANQRTLGQAVHLYAQDFRGQLPLSSHTTGNAFHPGNWITTLVPYGVPPEARRCPADPTERTTSYVLNDYLEPGGGDFSTLDRIPRPTATAYAAEAAASYGTDHLHAHLDGWTQPENLRGAIDVERHQGASNFVYLDTHAAALPWRTLQATFGPEQNLFNPLQAR